MKISRNKIKMIIATVAVVAVSFSATFAFLTSKTDEIENTFTPSSNIAVKIDEPNWKSDENKDGHYGENDAKSYTANQFIEKDPYLTNNTTSTTHNDEYMSLELSYVLNDENDVEHEVDYAEFSKVAKVYYKDSDSTVKEGFNPSWTALSKDDSEHGIYDRFYYKGDASDLKIVPKDGTTDRIFDFVKINTELKLQNADGSTNTINLKDVDGNSFTAKGMPKFNITVKGFAVQADNIETSEAKSELLNLMKNN